MDRSVAGTDRESDLVALFRLGPCRLSFWRQLFAAVFIDVEQDAVLGHVGVEPCTLSGYEGLAVDGEAIVLVPFREQILLPHDAEGGALVFAEPGVFGEEACLVERLGEPPQRTPSPFVGLNFFQTAAWSSREAEAIVRSSVSFGMSPAPI
jgi:hypothetical protein